MQEINQNQQEKVFKQFKIKGKTVKQYAFECDQNYPARQHMEDSQFAYDGNLPNHPNLGLFSVLDGHGGKDVVDFTTQELPQIFQKNYNPKINKKSMIQDIFSQTNRSMKDKNVNGYEEQGTCICLILIEDETASYQFSSSRVCTVANLGDTRCVLNDGGKAVRLTVDHKATNTDEIKRVQQSGGTIFQQRLGGTLAVTRALGDQNLISIGLSIEPNIYKFPINAQTNYLILATDGLWDVVDDDEAIQLTKDKKNAQQMVSLLMQKAKEKGSRDNIAIMAIIFS